MAEDGDNWVPPTEAELKVLQAKRERSDKISRLMADYLLRGYRMLNSVCDHCESVLLQDRHQKTYCVACSDVDNEHAKDNPALSGTAAQRQMQESQLRSSEVSMATANGALIATETPSIDEAQQAQGFRIGEDGVVSCIQAVQGKMLWASKKLTKTNSPEASLQWCSLLKACAETMIALRNAQSIDCPLGQGPC